MHPLPRRAVLSGRIGRGPLRRTADRPGPRPRLLFHGHIPLTENFTTESLPALSAALRDLYAVVADDIAAGRELTDALARDHLPEVLREHPAAVLSYLVMHDGFVQRVHDQGTGYRRTDGEGVDPLAPAQWAAALDLLGGGQAEAFCSVAQCLGGRLHDHLGHRRERR